MIQTLSYLSRLMLLLNNNDKFNTKLEKKVYDVAILNIYPALMSILQNRWAKTLLLYYHYYDNGTILLFIINVISVNDSGNYDSSLRKHDTTACLWNIHPPSGWRPRGFRYEALFDFRWYSRCTSNSPHTITLLLYYCAFLWQTGILYITVLNYIMRVQYEKGINRKNS